MPYVKTNRPPGRPRGRPYVTVSARVPEDLADQMMRYATRHRQGLSDVIKEGVTLLLEKDRYSPFMSHTNDAPPVEKMSDINSTPEIVSDTITIALGIVPDTQNPSESLADALHRQRLREIVCDTIPSEPALEMVSDINEAPPMSLDAADLDARPGPAVAMPDFDPVKYRLGKLCKRGHEWGTTGQSLRVHNKAGYCLACNAVDQQAIRKTKTQTPPQKKARKAQHQAVGI